MAKIILKRDVSNLGDEGDIKEVADGYARNFLIPKKFAVLYCRASLNELTQRARYIERIREEKRKKSVDILQRLEAMELTISVISGENGKIFGSVTPIVIVQKLAGEGIIIEKKKIELPLRTIKMLGIYAVKINLYENKIANLRVNVVAQEQEKTSKG